MNLYELNKNMVAQLPPLSAEERVQKNKEIWEFCEMAQNEYYMLLCHELRYFTLFNKTKLKVLSFIEDEVIACAEDLGQIVSIETKENAIEIWIKHKNIDEAYVMYFFPYDAGVIKCQ